MWNRWSTEKNICYREILIFKTGECLYVKTFGDNCTIKYETECLILKKKYVWLHESFIELKNPSNTANIAWIKWGTPNSGIISILQNYGNKVEKRNHNESINENYVCTGIPVDFSMELFE